MEDDLRVIGDAQDGESAVRAARQLRPDVVLMDVRMPGMDGLAATEQIVSLPRAPRVLVLTMFNRDEYVWRALRAGASGFLLKDVRGGQLTRAIRSVAGGDSIVDPTITRRLIEERFSGRTEAPSGATALLEQLTARETEVLRLVARGLSNAEIAALLVLGETTVKTHVARILAKLQVRDRVQAVIAAYEGGLVRTPG